MGDQLRDLRVRGPFRGGSGYDHHTREFVRGLVRQGVRVELRELEGWSPPLSPGRQQPFFESLHDPVAAQVDLQFTMPHQISPVPGVPCVNYTMFECSRIPPDWVRRADECALVIVPTQSGHDAWVASGVPADRLRIAPLGVHRHLYEPLPEPLSLLDATGRAVSSYRRRFLNVAELSPRKNLLGLLRCWLRATKAGDDAILILKSSIWRGGLWELFQNDLEEVVRAEGRTFDQAAPIVFVTDYLTDEEMPRLYRAATHYVSLSFGEGWDLPMTEAAAAGLSLLAPRHTAYLDYLDERSVHWIPVRETPVDFAGQLARADLALFDQMSWWTPDEDATVETLSTIIAGRAEEPRSPRDLILERYDWDIVTGRLLEVLGDAVPAPAARPRPVRPVRLAPGPSTSDGAGASTYLDDARAAATLLASRWFTPDLLNRWVPAEDYWKAPTIAQQLVLHMSSTGTSEFRPLVDLVRRAGESYLDTSAYLDDATVWGRFQLTAYDWITATGGTGADLYLRDAGVVFDGLVRSWDTVCGGGLYWMRPGTDDPANFKAINATLGLMEIGLGLHRLTGRPDTWAAADRAWSWIKDSGLIDAEGLVWGGFTATCVRDPANVPVVALQGNPLLPLWWRYQVTGESALLDLAERIVDAALSGFVWPGSSILRTPVDGDWAGEDAAWRASHQNDATFKGVFCGFLGRFTASLATVPGREAAAARYAVALRANADALTSCFPAGIYPMDWHTPDPGYPGDPDQGNAAVLQYSGLAALDAAAAATAAAS